jgi:transposase InsO family protein
MTCARLRGLALERRRFGHRRLHVLLRREGRVVNRKKTQRLSREEGLSVRKWRGRKKAAETRAPLLMVAAPNARWSVDPRQAPRTCGGTMAKSTTSSHKAAASGSST